MNLGVVASSLRRAIVATGCVCGFYTMLERYATLRDAAALLGRTAVVVSIDCRRRRRRRGRAFGRGTRQNPNPTQHALRRACI